MIPAKLADRIDDLIHLTKRHSVHLLVEFMEICPDLLIIVGIVFVVVFVEHCQDRFPVPEIGWICFDMRFQFLKIGIYDNIPPLKFVVCYLGLLEIATVISAKYIDKRPIVCLNIITTE